MPQMSTGDVRVVDPILTTHVRGYKNTGIVRAGGILFPRAPIFKRGAKIIKFGKEAFRKYNTQRAPGTDIKVMQFGYASDTVSLTQHALKGLVPIEHMDEAGGVPGINLGMIAVETPMDTIGRELEIEQATLAQNASNYDTNHKLALSGTDRWDDYTNSNPGQDVDAAHEAIRASTGRTGNVMVMGPLVRRACRRHPKILGHFYTGAQSGAQTVSDAQLAEYFDVKLVVSGDEIWLPETALDTDDFTDVWGKNVVLAFVPTIDGIGNIQVPSYGYTYYLNNYPIAEVPEWDKDKRSWLYPVLDEVKPVQTGMNAGFLFTTVIS
ncbi:MAG: major capsid protein [Methylovulum miyakonense]|uniref:major capsid protein n=1 Tax=Methylovulum miyakonense TaxID=645578 RepID=UPI003BB6CC68